MMTQIPPRGTPEFEEYKKSVEEAHRNGARIQIGREDMGWMWCASPSFDAWGTRLYRIAPEQPQFQNQQQEPHMTPTEQRIVKALDQIVYALAEVYGFAEAAANGKGARIRHLHDYTDKASRLVTALVNDLPPSSPSPAPSEATAPAQFPWNGGLEATLEAFEQDAETVQFASHAVGDRVRHFAAGWTGVIEHIDSTGTAWVATDEGLSKHYDLCVLENLTRKEAIEAAGDAADKVQHEASETGAVRSKVYPQGAQFPIRLDLLFRNSAGLRRLAETWGEGEAKYGPDNWMKGHKESCYISHALEHIRLYLAGDKSEDHLAHGAWNLLALCWVEENKPELLDLTKPNQKP